MKELLHELVDTVLFIIHGASGTKMADVLDKQVIAHGASMILIRAYYKMAGADNRAG